MPEFHLRTWAEQTLFDCNDYTVTAETLEAAVALLEQLQEQADETGKRIDHADVRGLEPWLLSEVMPLDPADPVEATSGFTQLDEHGERVRDLVGVPVSCVQLGDPLEPGEISYGLSDCPPLKELTGDVYRLYEDATRAGDGRAQALLRYVHEAICKARYEVRGEQFNREMPSRPVFVRLRP